MNEKISLNEVYNQQQKLRVETASYIIDMRKLMLKYAEEESVDRLNAVDATLHLLDLLRQLGCKTLEEAEDWILFGVQPSNISGSSIHG